MLTSWFTVISSGFLILKLYRTVIAGKLVLYKVKLLRAIQIYSSASSYLYILFNIAR